jgi:hypothetical protein
LERAATLRQPSRRIVEPSPTTKQRSTAARRPSIISPSHFWIAATWDLVEKSNVYSRRRLETGTILEPLRFSCNFATSNHCGCAVAGGGWLVAWVVRPTAWCIEILETKTGLSFKWSDAPNGGAIMSARPIWHVSQTEPGRAGARPSRARLS